MIAILLILALAAIKANAKNDVSQLHKVRGTCYLPTGNKTASGTVPMQFRTVAARREDLGKTCLVYAIKKDGTLGELIFIGICEDTGGHIGLRNGERIDIFMDNETEMRKFVKKYGDWFMCQIIPSKG